MFPSLFLALVLALSPDRGSSYVKAAIPSTAADITTATVMVDEINLANTSADDVTVTIVDKSTNCNSGACSILDAVLIAGHTTYAIRLDGHVAAGLRWSASTANAVHGFIKFRQ